MKIRRYLTKGNKHVRKELNELWKFVIENTLVDGLPGWSRTPQGLIPPRNPQTYIPLSPLVFRDSAGDQKMRITPGWVRGPIAHATGDQDHEIPLYHLGEIRPTVNGSAIDDADSTSVLLGIEDSNTNTVYMDITLTEHITIIGDTTITGSGHTGHHVHIEPTTAMPTSSGNYIGTVDIGNILVGTTSHNHGGTAETAHQHVVPTYSLSQHTHTLSGHDHDHEAQGALGNITYTIESANILVTTGDPGGSTDENHIVIMGKWTVNTVGSVTGWEWYNTGNFDYFPPTYTRSLMTPDAGKSNPVEQ